MKKITLMVVATMVALAPSLLAGGSAEMANEKLARVESLALEVRDSMGTMQTFVRFPNLYSAETHNRVLVRVKEDVNTMGDIIEKLHQNRSDLKDWQAELVTRLIARADSLSTEVGNAIRYIDDNPERDFRPVYEDYVDGAYQAADSMQEVVDNYLEWANSTS